MNKFQIFIASFLPTLILMVIDYKLAVIYFLLWFDKVSMGILSVPKLIGIEITTISTLLLGILYGPLGAAFIFFAVPILDGVRSLFVKIDSEWPPFVPGFANIVDSVLVIVAFVLASQDIFVIMIAILLIKYAVHETKDMVYGKPFDFMVIPNFVFNLVILLMFKDLVLSFIVTQ